MRFVTQLKSGPSTHKLDVDVSQVKMSSEQKAIATKLFEQAKGHTIDLDKKDPCEEGKCLASSLLSKDEFAKIRGLKAQLGGHISADWVIIDFCIHPITHKQLTAGETKE